MADAFNAHWLRNNQTFKEPHIVLGPDTVGIVIPMRSLDEIKKASISLVYSSSPSDDAGSTTALYCLLFKPYSVDNLKTVIHLYGNNAMMGACFADLRRVTSPYQLANKTLEQGNVLHVLCFSYSADNMKNVMARLLADDDRIDLNSMADNGNALHILCRYYGGDHLTDLVDLLITNGCDLSATTGDGWNALHLVCGYHRNNLKPLVEFFIRRGIDPAARTGNDGWTAFHLVCRYYRGNDLEQVMQLLVNNETNSPSAFIILCNSYSGDDLEHLLQLVVHQDHQQADANGWNALHHLCSKYKGRHLTQVVRFLLSIGIDVNALTKEGFTPLYLLCFRYRGDDLKQVIKMLIENGAEISQTVQKFDALSLVTSNNCSRSDFGDIVKLFYDQQQQQQLQYDPTAILSVCFLYRGPGLLDIVKRMIEKAPMLANFEEVLLIKDMKSAHLALEMFNLDLPDRKEVKDYLESAQKKLLDDIRQMSSRHDVVKLTDVIDPKTVRRLGQAFSGEFHCWMLGCCCCP